MPMDPLSRTCYVSIMETGDHRMRYQIMDASGHSEETYTADKLSTDQAMARFAELTGKGFKAVAPGKDGEPGTLIKAFDPKQESVLFLPQNQGG